MNEAKLSALAEAVDHLAKSIEIMEREIASFRLQLANLTSAMHAHECDIQNVVSGATRNIAANLHGNKN